MQFKVDHIWTIKSIVMSSLFSELVEIAIFIVSSQYWIDPVRLYIQRIAKPLMVEVRKRDLMQIIVGAAVLAVPVGFTEETWNLGQRLPALNVLLLALISIAFISLFVYLNFYRFYLNEFIWEYFKRVCLIYLFSLTVVGGLLTLIQQCPWGVDNWLAMKRIIILSFPASMSATITDALK